MARVSKSAFAKFEQLSIVNLSFGSENTQGIDVRVEIQLAWNRGAHDIPVTIFGCTYFEFTICHDVAKILRRSKVHTENFITRSVFDPQRGSYFSVMDNVDPCKNGSADFHWLGRDSVARGYCQSINFSDLSSTKLNFVCGQCLTIVFEHRWTICRKVYTYIMCVAQKIQFF